MYHQLLSPPPYDPSYPSPSEWAAHERAQMTSLLRTRVYNTILPPMVIFAAPDEIVYPSTLRLLRECVFPSPMHLQMKRYLYSFEWPLEWHSWEAQVHIWDSGPGNAGKKVEGLGEEDGENDEIKKEEKRKTVFGFEKVSELALADTGWHCNHCLKRLEDLLDEVRGELRKAYAKSSEDVIFLGKTLDERGALAESLSPKYIQEVLCEGKDIFNTLPEVRNHILHSNKKVGLSSTSFPGLGNRRTR